MSPSSQQQKDHLHLIVVERMTELVTAALSLVAALAWNDAIQALFRYFFHDAGSLYAKFLYALFITAVIVIISQRLTRITQGLRGKTDGSENER